MVESSRVDLAAKGASTVSRNLSPSRLSHSEALEDLWRVRPSSQRKWGPQLQRS